MANNLSCAILYATNDERARKRLIIKLWLWLWLWEWEWEGEGGARKSQTVALLVSWSWNKVKLSCFHRWVRQLPQDRQRRILLALERWTLWWRVRCWQNSRLLLSGTSGKEELPRRTTRMPKKPEFRDDQFWSQHRSKWPHAVASNR